MTNARAVDSRALFALVDVKMQIAGIVFSIFGVQARREPDGNTSVRLPTFKDTDGAWKAAVQVPDEVRGPLAAAALAFLVDEGIAKRRFEPHPYVSRQGKVSATFLRGDLRT